MLKQKSKSTIKSVDTYRELVLMRHTIRAIRCRVNRDLDDMIDQINRLIPKEDSAKSRKFKNFTKKDWREFLTF